MKRVTGTLLWLGLSLIVLLAAVAATLLLGCSGPAVAGATSETTNGDLQAAVTRPDGSPAAGARVWLIDDEDWLGKVAEGKSVALDSAVTDAAGKFTLRIPLTHRCNLQIEAAAEGAWVRSAQALTGSGTRSFPLAAYGKVSGKVGGGLATAGVMRLAGTAYDAVVGADSAFAFARVPAGSYALMAIGKRAGAFHAYTARILDVAAGADLKGQDVAADAVSVLLDDFSLGWKQSALGRVLGDGMWYTATDIGEAGNSGVKVDFVTDTLSWDGSSVRAEYVVGSRLINPWSIMGCNIGQSIKGQVYDFSGLTAVSLMAKGTGVVNVKLLSRVVQRDFQDSVHYYFPLKLSPTWTRVTIPVDSLRMPDYAPAAARAISWAQAAKEMQTLDFTVERPQSNHGDTVVFWADDIRLEGLSLESLVP